MLSKKKRKIEKKNCFLLHETSFLCHFVHGNIIIGTWRDVPRLIIN